MPGGATAAGIITSATQVLPAHMPGGTTTMLQKTRRPSYRMSDKAVLGRWLTANHPGSAPLHHSWSPSNGQKAVQPQWHQWIEWSGETQRHTYTQTPLQTLENLILICGYGLALHPPVCHLTTRPAALTCGLNSASSREANTGAGCCFTTRMCDCICAARARLLLMQRTLHRRAGRHAEGHTQQARFAFVARPSSQLATSSGRGRNSQAHKGAIIGTHTTPHTPTASR